MRWRTVAVAVAALGGALVGVGGVASPAGPQAVASSASAGLGRLPAGWHSACRLAAGPALAPAREVRVQRGVRYTAGELLDLYVPVGRPSRRPLVLAVHGGGWRSGDRAGMAWTASRLARAGFVVAAPDYALAAPGHPAYPRSVEQLRAAVRFLRAHAAGFGADPSRIGVLGSSAGGHLGLLLADMSHGPCTTGDRVAAVVTWSAPVELSRLGRCPPAGGCPLGKLAAGFLGCASTSCPQLWDTASPVNAASPDDPPTLLFTSTHELVPAGQAAAMARVLRGAAVPVWQIRLPGHRHASDYRTDAIGPSIAFLERVLTGRG